MKILDLFAGPGGWDVALKRMGLDPLGVEWDDAACATREAAGLRTLQGNVAELDPSGFGRVDLFIASPPCQAWSMAGKRLGEKDKQHVIACAHELAMGHDTRVKHGAECEDNRSMLVVEPIRFIRHLKPTYVALEQVPPVLEAERYGVPQTRERAILIASLNGPVAPPAPTHQRYIPGEPQRHDVTFDGEVLPWVSMAEALGWQGELRRSVGERQRENPNHDLMPAAIPCPTLDSKARSWERVNVPAPTVTAGGTGSGGPEPFGRGGRERLNRFYNQRQVGASPRPVGYPAPCMLAEGLAHGVPVWDDDPQPPAKAGPNAVRVTEEEAAILQSFSPDYPFQGSRSKRFEQIGNAVPPLLAEAVLRSLLNMHGADPDADEFNCDGCGDVRDIEDSFKAGGEYLCPECAA